MDLLVVDTLEAEVMAWLGQRHRVRHAPELAFEPREFRRALYNVRAAIVPGSVAIDTETRDCAPVPRRGGRLRRAGENSAVGARAGRGSGRAQLDGERPGRGRVHD